MLFAIDKMKCVCVCNLLMNSVDLFISFKTLSNVDALMHCPLTSFWSCLSQVCVIFRFVMFCVKKCISRVEY